jgi:hypothetical protein
MESDRQRGPPFEYVWLPERITVPAPEECLCSVCTPACFTPGFPHKVVQNI